MQSSWQRTRIRRRCVLTHFNSRSHFILTWQPKCHFNDTIGANKSLLVYLWQIEGFLFYIMQEEFLSTRQIHSCCADVHTWVRVNGSALKQDSGSPVGQGPIDTVTVSCYPANICHTAEHVPVMVAEHILVMRGKIDGTVELKKRSRYDI